MRVPFIRIAHKTRGINDACNHSSTVPYNTIPDRTLYVSYQQFQNSHLTGFKDEKNNNELEPKTNSIMGLYVVPIKKCTKTNICRISFPFFQSV